MAKKATAAHKTYHRWLMDSHPCFCGCGRRSTVVHHPLSEHPAQGTRRNHEYVVPMWWECHNALHLCGNERKWKPELDFANGAALFRDEGIERGLL